MFGKPRCQHVTLKTHRAYPECHQEDLPGGKVRYTAKMIGPDGAVLESTEGTADSLNAAKSACVKWVNYIAGRFEK